MIGRDFNPGKANFVAATESDDVFDSMLTDDVDVICGFGGNDSIFILDAGDVFLGGDGDDLVSNNYGTFIGGEGNDRVRVLRGGTFNGDAGDDTFVNNLGGTFNQ